MSATLSHTIDGRYRVLAELGSGGMGTVLKVEDLRTGRLLALKILSSDGGHEREKLLRFRREFRAASMLSHPNVVRVHEFVSGRMSYFTMELVPGVRVSEYFGVDGERASPDDLNRPQRLGRVVAVLRQMLQALTHIHEQGFVHRDLKPDNVLVADDEFGFVPRVKVMDFGLARDLHAQIQLTQPGVVLGTLAYVSPEQASGRPIDGRADLYALGVILYRLLTGTTPFSTDAVSSILWKHCAEIPDPPRQRNPGVDRFLESVCLRLLRKDPAERWQSAAELEAALARSGPPSGMAPVPVVTAARAGRLRLLVPRMVGRDVALGHLEVALRAAQTPAGLGSRVVVSGPSGMGKSRLVREAAERARRAGMNVLVARFPPADPRPGAGLLAFLEDVELLVRDLPDEEAARLLGGGARVLAELAPGLGRLEMVRRAPPVAQGLAPFADRVVAALGELAAGLGRRRGATLLVLEDVDRADQLGRQAVAALLAAPVSGLTLIATAEAPVPGLESVVGVPLAPLAPAHTTLLARSMLGQDEEVPGLEDVLVESSGGVPYHSIELLRLLAEEGVLGREGGRMRIDSAALKALSGDAFAGPRGLGAVLRQRLSRRTAVERRLLQAAAVAGREASFELLVTAADAGEDEAIDAIEALLRAELLVEPVIGTRLALSHERLREAVLEGLAEVDRRRIHGLIGAALEAGVEAAAPGRALLLVHHGVAAGDRLRALYHLDAAQEYLARLSGEEAAAALGRRLGV